MHRLFLLLALLIAAMAAAGCGAREANALANPLKTGSNSRMRVPRNFPTQIAAQSANCSVTLDVARNGPDGGANYISPTTAICSGYNPTSPAGLALTRWTCAMPICTDGTKCDAPWVTRDATPGAIWAIALDAPTDAGVDVIVERGAGCQSP